MKIIGHRGAAGLAPENTIASLRKAIELGVDMVEFDVRVTLGGIPVLHHDPLPENINDLPTLADALKSVNGKVPLYIEVKPNEPVGPILDELKKYRHKYYLASKGHGTLLELHAALPDVPTIVIEPWSGVRARYRARQLNTRSVAMNQLWLWCGFIRIFARNYELYAYTLNDPAKAMRWSKAGLAGAITDYPNRFIKLRR